MRPAYAWWVLTGPAALWLGFSVVELGRAKAAREELTANPPKRGEARVAGSDDCRRCHPAQYESWRASYHRTMTQPWERAELLAPFEGEHYDYKGFRATMSKGPSGRPTMRVQALDDEGRVSKASPLVDAEVSFTVGSHRYQQYVAELASEQQEGVFFRLPMAWHREEGRWIHMNGAFVEPEGERGDSESYLRHLSRWNDNCVFCHNTEPSPGLDLEGRFDTQIGEVGIACEACHGRGGAHVAAHANPFERMLATGQGDPSIAHPGRLDTSLANDVCGRCHGNRIARDIGEVLARGDGFVPGEPLSKGSRPIRADSQLVGTEGTPFSARFWPDQTPRLSAYEYQALSDSACASGGLGCNDCHTMHGDEPSMQLRTGSRTSTCEGCHAQAGLSAAQGANGHGGHAGLDSPQLEPDCVDCHMPRITYGLLEGMITHRIAMHLPSETESEGKTTPDACTQCHVDRSRDWALRALPALRQGERLGSNEHEPPDRIAKVQADLVGGDPLQRNLAAHALARPKATGTDTEKMAALAEALDDPYPSVRWFAWRGLRALERESGELERRAPTLAQELRSFDYLADAEFRVPFVSALRRELGPGPGELNPELREQGEDEALWIGE